MNEIKCPNCKKSQNFEFDYMELDLTCPACLYAFKTIKAFEKTETSREIPLQGVSKVVLEIKANRQFDERAVELLKRKQVEKLHYGSHLQYRNQKNQHANERTSSFIPEQARRWSNNNCYILLIITFILTLVVFVLLGYIIFFDT